MPESLIYAPTSDILFVVPVFYFSFFKANGSCSVNFGKVAVCSCCSVLPVHGFENVAFGYITLRANACTLCIFTTRCEQRTVCVIMKTQRREPVMQRTWLLFTN